MTEAAAVRVQLPVEEAIQEMVATIVRDYHPLAILLFGSRARGDHRPTSDVDLLVVLDNLPEGASRRQVRAALYNRLAHASVAKDIIVATSAQLIEARGDYSSVLHWAQEEGVTLYDARS